SKARDAKLNARIMELEWSAKENEKQFAKLGQKQNNTVNKLENDINISDLISEFSLEAISTRS
ncbi:11024_t:CDS:2, partial [Gigaspora margarita]